MIELLRRSELFAPLPDVALAAIAAEFVPVFVPGQRVLFLRDEPSDGMYVVTRGRLVVIDDAVAPERVLAQVGRGDHVGELSLLTEAPRGATVRAVRDTSLLRLPPEAFHRVMEGHPALALRLARSVTALLTAGRRARAARVATITVLPSERGDSVDGFAQALGRALAGLGRTAVVDRPRLASEVGAALLGSEDAERSPVVSEAFDALEAEHDLTVFVGDADATPWTQRCVRQADVVLEVARGPERPRDAPSVELATLAERRLVVLRPRGTSGRAAARIAAGRHEAHHVVDPDRPDELARLARLLTGSAHGLALSGGSRRTVAYVGVLRALAEAGVPVDVVAGTSGGALLGAMRALEWDHAQMLDAMDHIDRAPLWRDLGPPFLSMMSGHHYERLLRGLFGDLALEDLALPLLPVCARLRDGAVVVPARGELWRAVRASTALPGVWPPLPYEGELLVDGGISNHLPVDLARARCGLGPVVACDAGHELRVDHEDVAMVPASGWSRLARWLWPFGRSRRGLTLLDVLLSATCAAATRQREQAIADATLYLRPFAEADATSVAAMVALGYDTTRAALDRADPRVLGARAATTT